MHWTQDWKGRGTGQGNIQLLLHLKNLFSRNISSDKLVIPNSSNSFDVDISCGTEVPKAKKAEKEIIQERTLSLG